MPFPHVLFIGGPTFLPGTGSIYTPIHKVVYHKQETTLTFTLNQPSGVQTYSDSSSITITTEPGSALVSKSSTRFLICI